MSKPLPERFDCDDFSVAVNGETYHPHEGEWVELFPDQTVQEILATTSLGKFGAKLKAAKGDEDEQFQVLSAMGEQYSIVCEQLAGRIMDWNWTDRRGAPLPKPDGTAVPISRLSDAEIAYLLNLKARKQETPDDRKNG